MTQFSKQQLTARVMTLINSMVGYAQIDADLTIVAAYGRLRPLTDDPTQPLAGRMLTDAFLELFGCEEELQAVLAGNLPHFHIADVNRINDEQQIQYFDFKIFPLSSVDPAVGLLFMVENRTGSGQMRQTLTQQRNETELARTQLAQANYELRRLNRLKTLFLSMAAHDLRTPLGLIGGFTEMLLANPANEAIHSELETIAQQTTWLNRLITDIVDLDRLEQGQIVVNKDNWDLCHSLKQVQRDMQYAMMERDIQFDVNMPAESVWIEADSQRIKQILYNLLGNSMKFTPPNGTVRVTLQVDETADEAVLRVSDTGRGIRDEDMDRLFQLYYRTPEEKQTQGTGLGLYIVHTLVKQHDGTIHVESEFGHGTTFIIRFPLLDVT